MLQQYCFHSENCFKTKLQLSLSARPVQIPQKNHKRNWCVELNVLWLCCVYRYINTHVSYRALKSLKKCIKTSYNSKTPKGLAWIIWTQNLKIVDFPLKVVIFSMFLHEDNDNSRIISGNRIAFSWAMPSNYAKKRLSRVWKVGVHHLLAHEEHAFIFLGGPAIAAGCCCCCRRRWLGSCLTFLYIWKEA